MKQCHFSQNRAGRGVDPGLRAQVRPLFLLVMGVVAAGLVLVTLRLRRPAEEPVVEPMPPVAAVEQIPASPLSEATQRVLQRLKVPVELRFYALLEDNRGTVASQEYAARVSELLKAYERAGRGLVKVRHLTMRSSETEVAARSDGVEPVPAGSTGTNYLGLAVAAEGQRVVMSRLLPEWEGALEFDVSRAIARVAQGQRGGEVLVNPAPELTTLREEMRQTFPDLETLPLEEARKQLLNAGLEQYKEVVAEFQVQLQKAQAKLAQAQLDGPVAVEEARKALRDLQARQGQQLSDISQRMRDRIAILEQVKAGQL